MNKKKLKFLRGINKISSMLHLGTRIFPNVVYSLIENNNTCALLGVKDDQLRIKLAEDTIEKIHKDPQSSSITSNCIVDPTVDLQIILPVYNTETFLKSCINSVLNQKTKYSWHLVIINDGSTDGSANILKDYENINNITIIHQDNKGHSGARNTGLNTIFGRYICFLDSDDMLAPNAIDNWLDAATKCGEVVVDGGFIRKSLDGKLYNNFTHTSQISESGYMWTKIYPSSTFKNIHFPEKYWFEDSLYAFLIRPNIQKINITDTVYYYTANLKSVSHTYHGNPKAVDAFYVIRSLVKDCKKLNENYGQSAEDINTILKHFQFIWQRTYSLGKEIEESIFILSCALWNKYYNHRINAAQHLRLLQKAMNECDFNLYRRECVFMA